MSPAKVRAAVVVHRSALIDAMLAGVASLPLGSLEKFAGDDRNVAAAESYLRRGLEMLFDLGRHILAKGIGKDVVEYRQVALGLQQAGVLDEKLGAVMVEMAGYRNRLVHVYDEVTTRELFTICTERIDDVGAVRGALLDWLRRHPERVEGDL